MSTLTSSLQREFQLKSMLRLSITAGSVLFPIAIYHLLYNDLKIGAGALAISLGLFLGSWSCYKKTYNSIYTFILLIPFSTYYVAYQMSTVGISFSYWSYPTVLLFYFMLTERQAWVSNIVFVLVTVPLAWHFFEVREAARFAVTLLAVSAYAAVFLRVISKQNGELSQLAITDPLTGVYNRSLLEDSLDKALHQSGRTDTAFSLIGIDIDNFKQVNDELGHDTGDYILMRLGAFLKSFFRESDRVFRTGGEEFLVLVHNSDEVCCIDLAEKVRKEIEVLSFIPGRRITVSIGVAGLDSEKDWKVWMKRCDENLYQAKNSGRNKVVAV